MHTPHSVFGEDKIEADQMRSDQTFASQKAWMEGDVGLHSRAYDIHRRRGKWRHHPIVENHRLCIDLITERKEHTQFENESILPRELNLINIIILLWSLLLRVCVRTPRDWMWNYANDEKSLHNSNEKQPQPHKNPYLFTVSVFKIFVWRKA